MSFLCLLAHQLMHNLFRVTDIQHLSSPPKPETPRENMASVRAVGGEREGNLRHLQRRWSWACLSHSRRRGEKPGTSGVHQSCWEYEISLSQQWSAVTRESQGNQVLLVKQMTQTWSVRMWKCSAGARINKNYTAGWLLFKLNQYAQTRRKWMGGSILLISH